MTLRQEWLKIIIGLLIMVCGFQLGYGANITISELKLEDDKVYLSVRSEFADAIDVANILREGIKIEFAYQITVFKIGGYFIPDQLIKKIEVKLNAKKDILNGGYEVTGVAGGIGIGLWFSKPDEVVQYLSTLKRVPLITEENLKPDSDYFAEVQLEATSLKLYPPLSLIYNLFGKWNYSSPKIRSRKFNRNGISME